ncbi:MAG: signal peptidase II, partial [Candidatus Firestonebacteria bacterium]|nr:signal peptidase II [Candidatus Firestonebacteria bacterium]
MFFIIIAAIVVAIDQFTKYYIKTNMFPGESIPVINNIFHITFIKNSGGAFGIMQDKTTFFIIASTIAIISILIFYY